MASGTFTITYLGKVLATTQTYKVCEATTDVWRWRRRRGAPETCPRWPQQEFCQWPGFLTTLIAVLMLPCRFAYIAREYTESPGAAQASVAAAARGGGLDSGSYRQYAADVASVWHGAVPPQCTTGHAECV